MAIEVMNRVPTLTPIISNEFPLAKVPAYYMWFGGEVAVQNEDGNLTCAKSEETTNWVSTTLKVASMVLSFGLLPLIAMVSLYIFRSMHDFQWEQVVAPVVEAPIPAGVIVTITPPAEAQAPAVLPIDQMRKIQEAALKANPELAAELGLDAPNEDVEDADIKLIRQLMEADFDEEEAPTGADKIKAVVAVVAKAALGQEGDKIDPLGFLPILSELNEQDADILDEHNAILNSGDANKEAQLEANLAKRETLNAIWVSIDTLSVAQITRHYADRHNDPKRLKLEDLPADEIIAYYGIDLNLTGLALVRKLDEAFNREKNQVEAYAARHIREAQDLEAELDELNDALDADEAAMGDDEEEAPTGGVFVRGFIPAAAVPLPIVAKVEEVAAAATTPEKDAPVETIDLEAAAAAAEARAAARRKAWSKDLPKATPKVLGTAEAAGPETPESKANVPA